MKKNTTIALCLITLLLAGCQTTTIRDDLATVEPAGAATIAADLSEMIASRHEDTATVFAIEGQGSIGRALSDALRERGYGVATEQQNAAAARTIEVRTDSLGKQGVLVSLVVDKEVVSRSYTIDQGTASPSSNFTRFAEATK